MMDFMGVESTKSPPHDQHENSDDLPLPPKLCTKSLEELTDQDVMQLTREDCRRYLKQKGMRRPSWNKAQALQQVMSLRSLCNPGKRGATSHIDLAPTKTPKLDQPAASSQLTMFYAGSVSVFEDVPADKAYAMMLLAANVSSWPPSGRLLSTSVLELPQARKASLQRFLQKRKERILKEDYGEKSPERESSKPEPVQA